MRTRAVLGSLFASTAVLVVGWQAGGAVLANQAIGTTTSAPQASGTSGTTAATVPSATPLPSATATAAPVAAGPADGTYTGSSVNTPFGSVQVAVTLSGGTITDVTAVHLTDADGRSRQISNYAAPMLRSEVLSSQSAHVSNVGGATYTTRGYLQSVQSALDQAGF
ncbi:MAG: FMN-binding protein [Salinibacterium sp.]|nr:FMN-binding protein [Salinibacterium sp.]